MGAVVHPAVGFIGSLAVGAVTLGAWCVFGALIVVAGTGVALVLLAGGVLLALDWTTDAAAALVRGAVGLATGSLMGDVLDPAVHA